MRVHCAADKGWKLAPGRIDESRGILTLRNGDTETRLGPVSPLSTAALAALAKNKPTAELVGIDYRQTFQQYMVSPSYVIVEIIDECDVRCPTCIAGSLFGKGNARSVASVKKELLQLQKSLSPACRIMISGGEPTLHPDLFSILALPEWEYFDSVYIISNGLKMAKSVEYCCAIRNSRGNIGVYLQFDSLQPEHLIAIRGEDYSSERKKSVENLSSANIPFILVAVVMRQLNLEHLSETVFFARQLKHCRGITFQPVKFLGRNEYATPQSNAVSALDTVDALRLGVSEMTWASWAPHPMNPLNCFTWVDGGENNLFDDSFFSHDDSKFVVNVLWHTDIDNFVFESNSKHPVAFWENGELIAQEFHYTGYK